jgi:protease II
MPGGDRRQMTFFADNVFNAQYGPVSSNWFVFQKDVGGNEQFQYYRYDLSTGNSTLLTDGKSRNDGAIFSRDGKTMLYTSTRRNGNDTDLYMVNAEDPKTDHVVAQLQGGGWGPLDITDDGGTALLQNGISVNESHLFLVDLSNGQMKPLTPASGPQIAYNNALFAKSGRASISQATKEPSFKSFARWISPPVRPQSLRQTFRGTWMRWP